MGHMAMPKPVTTERMDQQSLNRPGPMSESVTTRPYSKQLGLCQPEGYREQAEGAVPRNSPLCTQVHRSGMGRGILVIFKD